MGELGYHIPDRMTTAGTFVGITSYLVLPWAYACKNDSSPTTYDGVFPEFLQGFYKDNYGIDTGVIFKDGSWRISFHAQDTNTADPTDPLSSIGEGEVILNLSPGQTIVLKTYLQAPSYLIARVENTSGIGLGQLNINLQQSAYNDFASGATIHREMCIASNSDLSVAYFKGAEFYQSTLTSVYGGYVPMTDNNSSHLNWSDDHTIPNTNNYRWSQGVSNGYIYDMSSISFTNPVNL